MRIRITAENVGQLLTAANALQHAARAYKAHKTAPHDPDLRARALRKAALYERHRGELARAENRRRLAEELAGIESRFVPTRNAA